MPVQTVFLSSVVSGFGDVREAVAKGVTKAGYFVVQSEAASASPDSPRRALLDAVADADIYVLVLGERYGEPGANGKSPTEDEYDHAVANQRPLIVLVQQGELEPAQAAFLDRVRGTWGDGLLYSTFQDASDAALEAAAALSKLKSGITEDAPAANERAVSLVGRSESQSGGPKMRLAFVPLRPSTLLGAPELTNATLGDDLAAVLRKAGIVEQEMGISNKVSSAGVDLVSTGGASYDKPEAAVFPDGSVLVECPVTAPNGFGFALVDPALVTLAVERAGAFATGVWELIDAHGEVANVAIAAALLHAQMSGYGSGTVTSMHMASGIAQVELVTKTPHVHSRGDLLTDRVAVHIEAATRVIYQDVGGVQ